MILYDRDYTRLTPEELLIYQKDELQRASKGIRKTINIRKYPVAVRHYMSLFPNNYLDIAELNDKDRLTSLAVDFLDLLNNQIKTEREILDYINNNKAYFIIGSILKDYSFGHHSAYIFPEFQLGNSYKVDYLLVGKSSGGYEFLFIELEHPLNRIVLADGGLGEAFRKGTKQIEDWNIWLEENYQSLTETFDKYKHPLKQLPREFMKLDSSRFHYAVIAGRRTDFSDKTYRKRRTMLKNNINLLHYDNLYDYALNIIGKFTY